MQLESEADRAAEKVHEPRRDGDAAETGGAPGVRPAAPAAGFGSRSGAVPASVNEALATPGELLEPALRADLEARFGHDFSQVRVHAGATAARSTRDVRARAYTVGRDIVFGEGQFSPETCTGRSLLAHELAHVVQQSPPHAPPAAAPLGTATATAAAPAGAGLTSAVELSHAPAGTLQRKPEREGESSGDPWDNLSAEEREIVEDLYRECQGYLFFLARAQQAHASTRRSGWIKRFSELLAKIAALDNDDDVFEVETSVERFAKFIGRVVGNYGAEWKKVRERYVDERRWLMSNAVRSTDSVAAALYLDELYTEVDGRLKRGAETYITDEDYLGLKETLEKEKHLWVGALRGARIREKRLREMMDVVADLRRSGEDVEKFVPGWSERVGQETAYLESAAARARESGGYAAQFYPGEFAGLREDLVKRKQLTEEARPRETSVIEDVGSFVKGAVGAVVGVFVEAAKQVVDLTQIVLHFATLRRYEPKFISDLAAAAEQGQGTADLLKGMVTGLLETPSRFLNAVRKGDWEAIGREAVNVYLLAKTIRHAPEMVGKVPHLVAQTHQALRVLRARKVALEMAGESNILPKFQTPAPAAPVPAPAPTAAPVAPHPKRPIGFELPHTKTSVPTTPPAPEPQILTTIQPSRPVAGFARKLEPKPEPVPLTPGQTVFTEMPRARVVQGNQPAYGSVTPAMKGERTGQPIKATSEKTPPGGGPKTGASAETTTSAPRAQETGPTAPTARPEYRRLPSPSRQKPDIGVLEILDDGSVKIVTANRADVQALTGTGSHIALANAAEGLGPISPGARRYRFYMKDDAATYVEPLSKASQNAAAVGIIGRALQRNRLVSSQGTIINLAGSGAAEGLKTTLFPR